MKALVALVAIVLMACGAPGRAQVAPTAPAQTTIPARSGDLVWGVNGHPTTAYGSVTLDEQMAAVARLGTTHYRVGSRDDMMEGMLDAADRHGVTLLPIIDPDIDFERDSAERIRATAFNAARTIVNRYKDRIHVWELGNEYEIFAIIQPCETRDDGTKYPCEWGAAGGISVSEYYGPRWEKVSAALKGMSEGVRAADPTALRAVGTAGWGHIGAFERLKADGVQWDISVWHMYRLAEDEWAFKTLAEYGKPIWVTEFSHPLGSQKGAEAQARGLRDTMVWLRTMRPYGVEAAFVYELLDEPYWSDFEGVMGLIHLEKNARGEWVLGKDKPAFEAVRSTVAAGR